MRTVEFYINNKLYKSCPYDQWDSTDKCILNDISKNGYIPIYSERFMNKLPFHAKVYLNLDTYKCLIYVYKIFTGMYDKEGNKIYEDDTIMTPYEFESGVYRKFDKDEYYIRQEYKDSWGWKDYDIDNFKECIKIKDVNMMPKDIWNEPETILETDL